jgi:hypothetical protein
MMPVFSVGGNYFLFGSVFIKKNNQTEFKKKTKSNRNRFKPTGFSLARFFRFGSVLLCFFLVWLGFFRVFSGLGSVWFFWFQVYKTETELVGFFKILIGLIGFFSWFNFLGYFFSGFLSLIDFSVFFSPVSGVINVICEKHN